MLWIFEACIKKHLASISFSISFVLPGIGMLFSERCVVTILGGIFIAIGVLIFIITLVRIYRKDIPPRIVSFKKAKTIYGLWYSGKMTLEEGLIEKYHSKIEKLLLLNPEKMEAPAGHSEISKREVDKLTKVANSYGIPIKWYDKAEDRTMTFFDPENRNAWMVWQRKILGAPVGNWETYKISKKNKQIEYNRYLEEFNDIWNNHSHEPD